MSKLRQSAKGRNCTIRIPSFCNFDSETVVLAHVGKSHMGGKCNDLFGAFACSSCHDVIDGRVKTDISKEVIKLWAYEGMEKTQEIWLKEGLINAV